MAHDPFAQLPAFDPESGTLNAVIETPKGHRNKYKYDEKRGLFLHSGVLPAGAVFPFDFGFVPATEGGDGDPLDVLVLMDEPAFVGCLVPANLIGVIEAEQTEDGKTEPQRPADRRGGQLAEPPRDQVARPDQREPDARDRALLRLVQPGQGEEVQAARTLRAGPQGGRRSRRPKDGGERRHEESDFGGPAGWRCLHSVLRGEGL